MIFVIYIRPNNSHVSKILGLVIPIFAIIIQKSIEAQKKLSALVNRCATKGSRSRHKFDVAMQEEAFRFLHEFLI